MLQPFHKLHKQDKIDFFVQCQKLLITHHPASPFIFNKDNIKDRLTYATDIFHKYKGMCYSDENVCVLFNYVKLQDPTDPVTALKENAFKEGAVDYNAVSIDFVVFRELKDCLNFCRANYSANIEYIIFVKDGKPKVHKTTEFVSRILGVPIVKPTPVV